MEFYELRVNNWEEMAFEDPVRALDEAIAFRADPKNKVAVIAKGYSHDGTRYMNKRLNVRGYAAMRARLQRALIAMGATGLQVTHYCRNSAEDRENEAYASPACPNSVAYAAFLASTYKPYADITIDDSSYCPKFYDMLWTLRVYGVKRGLRTLVYETKVPNPLPHQMDW